MTARDSALKRKGAKRLTYEQACATAWLRVLRTSDVILKWKGNIQVAVLARRRLRVRAGLMP